MRPTLIDAWTIARLMADRPAPDELGAVSRPFRLFAAHLAGLAPGERQTAFDAFLTGPFDGGAISRAVDAADPEAECPGADPVASFATLADLALSISNQDPLWPGWINRGVLNVVAADPGTGKTRLAFDLAKRLWHGMPWPDGQPNTLPEGTRTLWVPGDRNFAEMLAAAEAYGLPQEAVCLGSSPDDPTGCLDLDDPETLAALAGRIRAASPAIVLIDTVNMTTARNLCRPEDSRAYFGPIMELAGASGVAFLGLTHLSANKEALGRRIVEKARIILKLTQPDPEGQPNRRKLWVDKSASIKPPALGVTMADSGNTYDFDPPSEPMPEAATPGRGRPPESCGKARAFVAKALNDRNDQQATTLCRQWEESGESKSEFWRARDVMVEAGQLVCEGKPLVFHLNSKAPMAGVDILALNPEIPESRNPHVSGNFGSGTDLFSARIPNPGIPKPPCLGEFRDSGTGPGDADETEPLDPH